MVSFQIPLPEMLGPAWSVETGEGQRGFWSLQWARQRTSSKRERERGAASWTQLLPHKEGTKMDWPAMQADGAQQGGLVVIVCSKFSSEESRQDTL